MLAMGTSRYTKEGGDLRRFYANPHKCYGGLDLHAQTMSVGLVSHEGETWVHRQMQAAPAPLLTAVAPDREGLVVAVECLCTWSWLADRCAAQDIPCVLGHALDMNAIHGGNATHAPIDSHKIAALLRGGMLPTASVYPAEMRSTRDRLRRRTHLRRTRAARLSPVQHPHAQDHWPDIGKNIAYQAHRAGVAARVHDPAVHTTIAVDLALIPSDEALRRDRERSLVKTATPHEAHTRSGLQTVPGIGHMLRLVRRDALHDLSRLPCVQDVASYACVVKGRQASAGQRVGTAGKTSGHAHLQGAFSEAATWFLRHYPTGQTLLPRLENTHGTGQALTILAHTRARAVSDRRKRHTAFDTEICRRTSRSRASEPAGARHAHGMSLHPARGISYLAASWNAQAGLGPVSQSPYA
jgi:hypothetical protein